MLRIRQKRAVTFARTQPQNQTHAGSSKSTSQSVKTQPTKASSSIPDKRKSRHAHSGSVATSKPSSQHPSCTPSQISSRQRRLASLFMALMASSPLPIEADAETMEAAQKASIAPRAQFSKTHKRRVSTVRVQEVRAGRWKKFRFDFGRLNRNGKRREEIEMDDLDDLVERRGEDMKRGSTL